MAKWMLKAAVQGSLSCLPEGQLLNYQLQKYVTKTARLHVGNLEYQLGSLRDIPEPVLLELFREFRSVLSPRGVMTNFVALEDHHADYDRSITAYNFLKYPGRVWLLFNNSLHYQNRLRVSDYRRILAQTGFRIVAEDNQSGPIEHLESIRVASQFTGYSKADLAVLRSWIVAARA